MLKDLLTQAGVHTDAYKAVFTAADDYKDSVVLSAALDPDAMLGWEMNGEPLRTEHGFPARLLIPGIYGMKNVKWLTGITIVADDFRGFWQNQGWDDAAPYQTESRIDTPGRATRSPPAPLASAASPSPATAAFKRSKSAPTRARRGWRRRSSQVSRPIRGSSGVATSRSTTRRTESESAPPTASATSRPPRRTRRSPPAPPATTA